MDIHQAKVRTVAKGQVIVLMVFFLTTALLLGGLVTDIGMLSLVTQRMKRAADAAALAGAQELPSAVNANTLALQYTARNGFTQGVNGVNIVSQVNPTGLNANWFRVTISYPFHFFFGQIIGLNQRTLTIFSTAQYNAYVPISINLAGIYGDNNPRVTLSVRGMDSPYEHGDPYSVPDLDNGAPNPNYKPDGYTYWLNVPDDYAQRNGTSTMKVDIFDPDSYGNYDSAGSYTTTTYKLYKPDNTPRDFTDDVCVATYTKGGDSQTNNKWINPSGFTVNTSTLGTGKYRIAVKSGSGYNANGFSLRAGPNTSTFDPNNGTSISANGPLPIRFNETGHIVMQLGYVPSTAAGTRMHINKFDTEIGSTSIIYSCDSLSQTWPGTLSRNSQWAEDIVNIPTNYNGGIWYATYQAGETDVSLWAMWYEGMSESDTGFVVLVE
jgi:hypothetical protein